MHSTTAYGNKVELTPGGELLHAWAHLRAPDERLSWHAQSLGTGDSPEENGLDTSIRVGSLLNRSTTLKPRSKH